MTEKNKNVKFVLFTRFEVTERYFIELSIIYITGSRRLAQSNDS